MCVEDPFVPWSTNGDEAEGVRSTVPLSRDTRSHSKEANLGDGHGGSEQCGAACTDVPLDLRDGTYAAWEAEASEGNDTLWIGAYEQRYIEKNWAVLQRYRDSVQVPSDGPFTFKDIKWEY
jgi:hypothetical protein